eukprot:2603571-Alexandrium_andersonii.AAC.1
MAPADRGPLAAQAVPGKVRQRPFELLLLHGEPTEAICPAPRSSGRRQGCRLESRHTWRRRGGPPATRSQAAGPRSPPRRRWPPPPGSETSPRAS